MYSLLTLLIATIVSVAALFNGKFDARFEGISSLLKAPQFVNEQLREIYFQHSTDTQKHSVKLHCEVDANVPVKYTWFRDGEFYDFENEDKKNSAEFKYDEHKRVSWLNNGMSGDIEIQNATSQDVGVYQCKAEIEGFGTLISDFVHLKIGVLGTFNLEKRYETVEIQQFKPLTIECKGKPSGNPMPTFSWILVDKQGGPIENFDMRTHINSDPEGNLHFSFVSKFDMRNDVGYMCLARSDALQGLMRMGQITRLNVLNASRSALPFFRPSLMYGSPRKIEVKSGDDVTLQCIFSGNEPPTVLWSLDGQDIPRAAKLHKGTLLIKNIIPEYGGRYTCYGENLYGKESHLMEVIVTAAPYWLQGQEPTAVMVPEGGPAEVKCHVGGDPKPDVLWTVNGADLNSVASYKHSVKNNGQTLIVDQTFYRSSRVYQCNASNPFGYLYKNIYLHILSLPPQFPGDVLEDRRDISAVRGRDKEVICGAIGAPDPKIEWFNNKDLSVLQIGPKYEVFENSSLLIKNVQDSDKGTYVCKATNVHGEAEGYRTLDVFDSSSWVKKLTGVDKTYDRDDSVTFTCKVMTDPRLANSVRYTWIKDDTNLTQQSMTKLSIRNPSPDTLVIHKARAVHNGTYRCVVDTTVDILTDSASIVVRDVPNAPLDINVECHDSRYATLKWRDPFSNHAPIIKYLVEYEVDYKPGSIAYSEEFLPSKLNSDDFNRVTREYQVDLKPMTKYTFYVSAINKYGKGHSASPDKHCQTKPSVPVTHPKNVHGQGTEPNNLVIYWDPVDRSDWGAPDFYYKLSWQRLDTQHAEIFTRDIHNEYQSSDVIHDQPIFVNYSIWVESHNSIGRCVDRVEKVVGYSGEAAPVLAPEWFTVDVEKPDPRTPGKMAAQFRWKSVPQNSIRGHLQGYTVSICKLQTSSEMEPCTPTGEYEVNTNGGSTLRVTIDSQTEVIAERLAVFEPLTAYRAEVWVRNTKYSGPKQYARDRQTRSSFFETGPSYPGKVNNLSVYATGYKSIFSEWEPPTEQYGVISGYHLTYEQVYGDERRKRSNSNESIVLATLISAQEHHHVLNDKLGPNTTYRVTVEAVGKPGPGLGISQVVRTFPLEPPEKPRFVSRNKTANSITFERIVSNEYHCGESFYLNYSRYPRARRWFRTQDITLPKRTITLYNLEPSVEYQVIMTAIDDKFVTHSDPFYFATANNSISKEQLGKAGESFTSTTWFIAVICALAIALLVLLSVCVFLRSQGGKYPVKKKELERGHHLNEADEEKSFMEYQYSL